ncbi:LOW QUALITY PROTEIN: olfactory receptor 6F1-like [Chlamydotis macqueenii]
MPIPFSEKAMGLLSHNSPSVNSHVLRMNLSTWEHTGNGSNVEEFIPPGFPGTWHSWVSLLVVFALKCSLTGTGSVSIIALVCMNSNIHTPMHIFLCDPSFLEMCYTTGVISKGIGVMLENSQTTSFSIFNCSVFSPGSTDCFLLSVMASDHYLAACYPLRYSSLMNSVLSARLALSSWLGGFLSISLLAFLTSRLMFRGPDVINHFLCDIDPCLVSIIVLVACCVTLVSYVYIISSMLGIQSARGQEKDFPIYSAHLSVFTIWYSSTVFLHVKLSARNSLHLKKPVIPFHTVVTPLLNCFIDTLPNKEVKQGLGWAFQKK